MRHATKTPRARRHEWLSWRTAPARRAGYPAVLLALAGIAGIAATQVGCRREPSAASEKTQVVVLRGTFEPVAREASGAVSVVRLANDYQLRLERVRVQDPGPVHVYLVGSEDVRSTSALDATDMKYDFGLLGVSSEQRIPLPGEPDPALRSVVLYNPKFGVVLASASLEADSAR